MVEKIDIKPQSSVVPTTTDHFLKGSRL